MYQQVQLIITLPLLKASRFMNPNREDAIQEEIGYWNAVQYILSYESHASTLYFHRIRHLTDCLTAPAVNTDKS